MGIGELITLLPVELLPFAIFALIGLYVFKAVIPYFRKAKDCPEDDDKPGAIG